MYTKLLIAFLFSSAALQAGAEPLNVKPGLWESTTATEKMNARQPTNLDKLSPEQRAKVDKKLAEQVKQETRTAVSCLREDKIQSGEAFTGNPHGGACRQTWKTRTAAEQVAQVDCQGANPMSGAVEMKAIDPEHMTGRIEMIYGAADRLQMRTVSSITSRWLRADCGNARGIHP